MDFCKLANKDFVKSEVGVHTVRYCLSCQKHPNRAENPQQQTPILPMACGLRPNFKQDMLMSAYRLILFLYATIIGFSALAADSMPQLTETLSPHLRYYSYKGDLLNDLR